MILATTLMAFCYVSEPIVTMREEPTQESRVASQTIFGEQIRIEKEVDNWCYITTPDGYKGLDTV